MKTITSINNKLSLETFHCTEEEYAQRLDEEINKIATLIHNQMLSHVKLLREIVKHQGFILDKKSNQFSTNPAKENKDISISTPDHSKVPEKPAPLSRGLRTLQSSSPLESLTEHLQLLGVKDRELEASVLLLSETLQKLEVQRACLDIRASDFKEIVLFSRPNSATSANTGAVTADVKVFSRPTSANTVPAVMLVPKPASANSNPITAPAGSELIVGPRGIP